MSSTIGSSIAAGASHQFATYFDITDQWQLVLPTSSYLLGYVLGPIFFGPLSESYGRKWVMVSTFVRTVARQSFDNSLNNASRPGTVYCFYTRLRFGKPLCDLVCTEVVRGYWRIQSDLCGGWVSMRAHKRDLNAPTDPLTSIYADVYPDPVTRGRALTIFMTVSNTHCILPHKIEEEAGDPNLQCRLSCQS
jgi:hypothetical protein